MRLSHATLYSRLLASDPTYDGRFFTGVLTTGIYCLPSCRARKPKAENVRFFPTCEAARAAGLRACKKCHPDDYARGADPVLATIEQTVAELRAEPAAFRDAAALIRRTGYGATRAGELFRQHFHATPAELILSARLGALQARLQISDTPLAELAFAVGYESLSVVHEHFRTRLGLTPAAWRALAAPELRRFTLELPAGYPVAHLLRSLGRDPQSLSERREGDVFTAAVRLGATPALLRLTFAAPEVRVEIEPATAIHSLRSPATTSSAPGAPPSAVSSLRAAAPDAAGGETPTASPRSLATHAHILVAGLLGLGQDAAGFARLARKLGLARLVAGREGLCVPHTLGAWDALAWAILGQQINLPFAYQLRRALTELAGTPVGDGLVALPTPAAAAALDPAALLARKFSRPKATYLLATARLVADGALDLAALAAGSATRAERTLLAIHGLGPWTVNYVMMRGLGFADCVPYGDTGVTSGLETLFHLDPRPDVDATRRLMLPFAPYRSLATAHLWQLHQPALTPTP